MRPLTEEQFKKLKEELSNIGGFLPDGKMTYIWSTVNLIRKENQPQPCSCKSSGGLWARAVSDLKNFVSESSK